MNNEDIIRLAEFCNRLPPPPKELDTWQEACAVAVDLPELGNLVANLFRPHELDSDCWTLIRALAGNEFFVRICHGPVETSVRIWRDAVRPDAWFGDDYKIGVCELALKLLGDGDE